VAEASSSRKDEPVCASQTAPPPVAEAIARALGHPQVHLTPLASGTNRRTFLVSDGARRWVARFDAAPAHSLVRAIDAQRRAQGAGIRVPETIAHGAVDAAGARYVWSVETFVAGAPFDHRLANSPEARTAIGDLGEQLRRLHGVALDAFGDLPPRPYPVYESWAAWVANKARRIDPAARLAGDGPETPPLTTALHEAYHELAGLYDGPPRFCKGDVAGDNLLVASGGIAAIIDWEWAQGLDPAADVAYWCRATPHASAHELLLAAYAPDDPPRFRSRLRCHQLLQCIETIHVLDEHRHAFGERERLAGIAAEWGTLRQLLGRR
jgi:aminoglycoside phosphotransferase (APT) family kinase protein